jgi:hypothetical protein
MRNTIALLFFGLLCVGLGRATGGAATRPSTFVDHDYGFALNAPSFPRAAKGSTYQRVFFFAPPEEQFASNVNVIIQEMTSTRVAYREQTLQGFKTLGYKVNSERNSTVDGKEAFFVDAEGEQQGKEMRFLSLAIFDTNRVVLTTCTCLNKSFSKYEAGFRASLDSFKLVP